MSADLALSGHRPTRNPLIGRLDFLTSLHAPDWMASSLCAQTAEPETFFPDSVQDATRHAKRICSMCEVRTECLAWALERPEAFGIWGGLSEGERRRLLRHPQERACTRTGCTEAIPASANGSTKYHDTKCAQIAYYERAAADLDQDAIVSAYTTGGISVSQLAARHKTPSAVIALVLDNHGIPRPRSKRWNRRRTTNQEAS